MNPVEEFLKTHGVNYIRHEHPAVFTCEEAQKYAKDIPGMPCKNLFLQDKENKRFFLVILPAIKKLSFSDFAKIAQVKKVLFADSKTLNQKLKLDVGSVSLFGILNDEKKEVELYIDEEVYEADIVSFHPNINTATLELSKSMLHKFLNLLDRPVKILKI